MQRNSFCGQCHVLYCGALWEAIISIVHSLFVRVIVSYILWCRLHCVCPSSQDISSFCYLQSLSLLTFHFLSSGYCCIQVTFPDLSLVDFSLRWVIWQFSCHRGLIKVGDCCNNCPSKIWQCHWCRQPLFTTFLVFLSLVLAGVLQFAIMCTD